MTRYFDTSAWVKRYLDEPERDLVLRWCERAVLATSRLTDVEVVSAVFRRARQGRVPPAEAQRILLELPEDLEWVRRIELTIAVTAMAQDAARQHGLRAGDSIQLASALYLQQALNAPIEFICFDQRLNAAARAEGLLTPVT